MNTAVDRNAERAEAILKRINELAEAHSQAEIARKTEFSRNNVSRYVNGTRMPIEFAAAMVEGLGVNPAWLLTGEGTPYLSDVTAGTQKMAGDVLALVKAMAATNRMRLGSLTGKHHLGVLRELNANLKTHEELRVKLNAHSRKMFLKLVEETRAAIKKRDLTRAEALLEATGQVWRLTDEGFLTAQYEGLQSYFYQTANEAEKALPHQRRSFLSFLLHHAKFDQWLVPEASNYLMLLLQAHQMKEARRIARATVELTDGNAPELAVQAATLDLELGDLQRGLSELRRLIPLVDPGWAHNVQQTLARGQLLEGSMSMEQAATFGGDHEAKWSRLAACAAACENAEWAELVRKRGVGPDKMSHDRPLAAHMDCLVSVMKEGGTTPAQELLVQIENTEQKQDDVSAFCLATLVTQLFRLGGDRKSALKHLADCDRLLEGFSEELTPRIEFRILHARNVLRLIKPDDKDETRQPMRARAEAFVRNHFARGYNCLKDLL